MTSRDLFGLEPGGWTLAEGDTGEALLRPHIAHNHDLDPSCRETPCQHGRVEGECMKVNDKGVAAGGVHADRDRSGAVDARVARVAPPAGNPLHEMPNTSLREAVAEGAADTVPTEPVWGDVRHHRERIDQLNAWVRYWSARARIAERDLRIARGVEP